jgi:hypothetical protein
MLNEMTTTKFSLFLKDLASVKLSLICQRATRMSAFHDVSVRDKEIAQVSQNLAKLRASFEPSAWLGPMMRLDPIQV